MKCIQVTESNLETILANTPDDKIALFEITAIPSDMEDFWLGEYVYITKKGTIVDTVSLNDVDGTPAGIRFVRYVQKDWWTDRYLPKDC